MKPCKILNSISPYLISEGRRSILIFNLDRHSVDAVTLRKYFVEYEQMWDWIAEFISKFLGIKIEWVNSIHDRSQNHLFPSISYVPLHAKWRHHELSFPFLEAGVDLYLVYIPYKLYTQKKNIKSNTTNIVQWNNMTLLTGICFNIHAISIQCGNLQERSRNLLNSIMCIIYCPLTSECYLYIIVRIVRKHFHAIFCMPSHHILKEDMYSIFIRNSPYHCFPTMHLGSSWRWLLYSPCK